MCNANKQSDQLLYYNGKHYNDSFLEGMKQNLLLKYPCNTELHLVM